MSEVIYQVTKSSPVTIRGRATEISQLINSKSNYSVIAPPFLGKTVLFKEVERKTREKNKNILVFYMDLKKGDIRSNEKFVRRFAEGLKNDLEEQGEDLADSFSIENLSIEELQNEIAKLLTKLRSKNFHCLVIMDHFERVLKYENIDALLYNWLATLLEEFHEVLRMMTGSQRPLEYLCTTVDQLDSNFWQLFVDYYLDPFKESDVASWLAPFNNQGVNFGEDAENLFLDWSGGVPVLAALIGNELQELLVENQKKISGADVKAASRRVVSQRTSYLKNMWKDLPHESREAFFALQDKSLTPQELGREKDDLLERGFARSAGDKYKKSCLLMVEHVKQYEEKVASLDPLFADPSDFDSNIAGVLSLRFRSVDYGPMERKLSVLIDNDSKLKIPGERNVLHRKQSLQVEIKKAIRSIHKEDPKECLSRVRIIHDLIRRALFHGEFGERDKFGFVVKDLTANDIEKNWPKRKNKNEQWEHAPPLPDWLKKKRIPALNRGTQMQALNYLTGHQTLDNVHFANHISRNTYIAATMTQGAANFGQHDDLDVALPMMVAVTACFSVLTFLELAVDDLRHLNWP